MGYSVDGSRQRKNSMTIATSSMVVQKRVPQVNKTIYTGRPFLHTPCAMHNTSRVHELGTTGAEWIPTVIWPKFDSGSMGSWPDSDQITIEIQRDCNYHRPQFD